MIELNNIKILQQQPENQQFDRKSFRIDPKALAIIVVAFANADGGDRMFREMAEAGNPAPEYKQVEFMVKVKLTSALREDNVKKDTEGTDNVLGNDLEKEMWPEITQKSSQESSQESSQKSSQKILSLMTVNPQITTQKIADELGVSRRAITKQITNLRKNGLIRRVGPDKGGHWEVIEESKQ